MEIILLLGGLAIFGFSLWVILDQNWSWLTISIISAVVLASIGFYLYSQPYISETSSVMISDQLKVNDRSDSEIVKFNEPVRITKIVSHKPYFLTTHTTYEINPLR